MLIWPELRENNFPRAGERVAPNGTPAPGWHGRPSFQTTRWSVVLQAAETQHPGGRVALEGLCKLYWPSVYAYIRRRGYDPDTALDYTQGFFTQLLEKKHLKAADPERGKFRSYLLTCVKNYLANEWDRQQAQVRGGGHQLLSLDEVPEGRHGIEPVEDMTPEKIFERTWALTLLDRTFTLLRSEMSHSGAEESFERLKFCLTGDHLAASYKEIAAILGITEAAVKTRVHRMRRRFGDLLCDELRQTLDDPSLLQQEIQYLLTALD